MEKKLLSQKQLHQQNTGINNLASHDNNISRIEIHSISLETPAPGICCGRTVLYDKNIPVHKLISIKAREHPEKTALVFEHIRLSYKELEERSTRLAVYLQHKGIEKQDIVALAIDRTEQTLICLLAIMKTGAIYLPVDLDFPDHRINFVINDAGTKFILTENKYNGRFDVSRELYLEDALAEMHRLPDTTPTVNISGKDIAYILYTSGSTGNPKGAQITQEGLSNFLLGMQEMPGATGDDRILATTTISFDIAALELYLPLVSGGTVVLAGKHAARDGYKLLELLKEERITIFQATPSTWRMLLESGWEQPLQLVAMIGGEQLPANLVDALLPLCISLWNMYGPTETTVWSTAESITDSRRISVGKPIINTRIYILDENQKPVANGEVGEICIAGSGVAAGYINRPETTQQRFLNDRFSREPGAKMYRTGDLGKILPDGKIACLGRADNQVKVRGYRVELEEIEHCIARINGIKEAIAAVHDDNIVAYVTIQPNADITSWREQLKEKLPPYMVPFDIIIIEKFTLTPNGKIDRKELPKPEIRKERQKPYVSPRNETEQFLAAIWEELLKVPQVSVTDDFFELGGHSLIGIQVMGRIYRKTGRKLPLAKLFEARTVKQMAVLIGELSPGHTPANCLVEIKPGSGKSPLYIVHGYGLNVLAFTGLANHMAPNQPVYGLQAIGLDGASLPPENMEEIATRYIAEILEKHGGDSFALAGYSFGGTIAFEMARQLTAMGKKVTMLAMFDAYNESGRRAQPTHTKLAKKFLRQVPKMVFIAKTIAHYPVDAIRYQYRTLSNRVKDWLNIRSYHPLREVHANADDILSRYETAYDTYTPSPFDGAIHVFKVKKRLYYLDDLHHLGWKDYARTGVHVHDIPGDHQTFLKSPYDKIFAAQLQHKLNEHQ